MKSNGVVIIHGAGLGSFILDELTPMLNLPTLAIDFPNRRKGDKSNLKLNFRDYAESVIQQIEQSNINNFILVTHSIGGCIGLKIAEYFQDQTIGFMGVSSAIPTNGNSFISCLPYPQKLLVPILLKIAGTKPPSAIETGLGNDLTNEQLQMIIRNFTPESESK